MVCKIFYASEYIQDCDISKFGEGCEQCVSLFRSSWTNPIIIVLFCALAIFIISIIIKHKHNEIWKDSLNEKNEAK